MIHSLRSHLRRLREVKYAQAAAERGMRTVPDNILKPPYANTGIVAASPPYAVCQSQKDIDGLRRAGQIARKSLELACSLAEVLTDACTAVTCRLSTTSQITMTTTCVSLSFFGVGGTLDERHRRRGARFHRSHGGLPCASELPWVSQEPMFGSESRSVPRHPD